MKPVTISDPARSEYREAVKWYRERDPRVAARFADETRNMLGLISEFQNIGSRVPGVSDPSVRRMPIHNFPYNLVQDLLVFVTTMCQDLSVAAQEIAIYAFVVNLRMFEHSSARRLPRARRQRIAAAFKNVDDALGRLTAADDRFIEQHARVSAGSEPFVMRYITEVLLEPDDPDALLPDDEVGAVFMCLKTVVDVLHDITPG